MHARSLLLRKKMSADIKHGRDRTIILTDSASKWNREDIFANYNKTRISIRHQHDHWMKLKEVVLRVQTHPEV